MNATNVQYGVDRMVEVIRMNISKNAQAVVDAIVNAAKKHADNAPQYDDMTVVVVKRVS
jgi:serine phosphatase RsbU (regulator of sigma subunit)